MTLIVLRMIGEVIHAWPHLLTCRKMDIEDIKRLSTGHHFKWDHFDILARGRSDIHCKIKETLLIRDLKPALNENVGSEKLYLY